MVRGWNYQTRKLKSCIRKHSQSFLASQEKSKRRVKKKDSRDIFAVVQGSIYLEQTVALSSWDMLSVKYSFKHALWVSDWRLYPSGNIYGICSRDLPNLTVLWVHTISQTHLTKWNEREITNWLIVNELNGTISTANIIEFDNPKSLRFGLMGKEELPDYSKQLFNCQKNFCFMAARFYESLIESP